MSFLIDKYRLTKKQVATLFLGGSALAGVIAFVIFIIPRSELGSQLMLGLSASRILIGLVFLGLLLINIAAMLLAAFDWMPWQKSLEGNVVGFTSSHLMLVVAFLYAVLVSTGALFLLTIPPIIPPLSFLEPVNARLGSFLAWIFFGSLLLIVMLRLVAAEILQNEQFMKRLDESLTLLGLFLVVFVLYWHFAALIGWVNKTRYSYWDLLAGQLIQGKLYLNKPPYTHDLTLYNGKWYLPQPPLPGILMMPLAYLIGYENISTSYLSMVFSGINAVLMFLILKKLNEHQWVKISKIGIFVLVTLLLFGTPHLYLGISGRVWYVSQILTLLFLALATYSALRGWSAWLTGTFVAIAMTARPNALMTWPFVFAISMQVMKERQGQLNLKQAVLWSLKTIPPIVLAIAGLLTYNYLRFDNFLDFGYTTVNAGSVIVQNVQSWGLFSPHFIPINLSVMLFKPPWIMPGGQWPILPSATGMSIFLTTPPLIYLFRRYPKQWWVIGAWAAVLFNVALLSLYSNTGAHQFGYRYILDFLVPLVALLAFALEKKIPWHFIVLLLISIAINLYGTNWFMNG